MSNIKRNVKVFKTKRSALVEYDKDTNNFLFQKDIGTDGSKQFYVGNLKELYNYIKDEDDKNYYETFISSIPVKFMIDFDLDKVHEDKSDDYLMEILDSIIETIKKHNIDITKEDFIVLKTKNSINRCSYHIILDSDEKFYFSNIYSCKNFYHRLITQFPNLKGIDSSIYGEKCFRLIGNTKKGRNSPLEFYDVLGTKKDNFQNKFERFKATLCTFTKIDYPLIIDEFCSEKLNSDKDDIKEYLNDGEQYSNLYIIQKITDMIIKDDYDTWFNVACILKQFGHDNYCINECFNIFNNYSKKSSKYNSKRVRGEWNKDLSKYNINIGTLHFYAKRDNQQEYDKFHKEDVNNSIMYCENNHASIARVINSMFQGQQICASSKNNIWMSFIEHRYKEQENAIIFRRKLINIVAPRFKDKIKELKSIVANLRKQEQIIKNDEEKKSKDKYEYIFNIEERIKHLMKIYNLLNDGYPSGILKACETIMYDENFHKNVNQNHNLICFQNGIIDLTDKNNIILRDGLPNDYITFCTGTDYIPLDTYLKNSENKKIFNELNSFMDDILGINKEFFLQNVALCLNGSNPRQKFLICHGPKGSNGKSVFMSLIQKAFGNYARKTDNSIIMQKKGRFTEANPGLVELDGVRFVQIDEPEKDSKFFSGVLKEYTGVDILRGRNLFSSDIKEIIPQFKMFFACNSIPDVDMDGGINRRFEVIEFKTHFVNEPNPCIKNQKKRIDNITLKFDEWITPFMSLLVDIYSKLPDDFKLKVPREIENNTNNYFKNQDSYTTFIKEFIHFSNNIDDNIVTKDAWEYYKIYCDNTGIEKKSQKKLIECLCNEYDDYKMGKTNKGFKCIKWKNLEELGIIQTN